MYFWEPAPECLQPHPSTQNQQYETGLPMFWHCVFPSQTSPGPVKWFCQGCLRRLPSRVHCSETVCLGTICPSVSVRPTGCTWLCESAAWSLPNVPTTDTVCTPRRTLETRRCLPTGCTVHRVRNKECPVGPSWSVTSAAPRERIHGGRWDRLQNGQPCMFETVYLRCDSTRLRSRSLRLLRLRCSTQTIDWVRPPIDQSQRSGVGLRAECAGIRKECEWTRRKLFS